MQLPKAGTLHLASPAPPAFCAGPCWPLHLLQGRSHPRQHQLSPAPLRYLSPFFAGAFLGLGSGFGRAGLADNVVDLLCINTEEYKKIGV